MQAETDTTATPHFVGVDLGGSSLRAVVTDSEGRSLAELTRPVLADEEDLVAAIDGLVRSVVSAAGLDWPAVAGLGVGVAGSIHEGAVSLATNLPGLSAVPLGAELSRRLGVEVVVDNDVNMAAVAEATALAGEGIRYLVFLAIGTGVGLGIVDDGRLVRGAHGEAGEIGFLPVSHVGELTVEDYAGGAAISRRYGAVAGTAASGREVLDLADHGEEHAIGIAAEQVAAVALAAIAVRYVLDPEVVVIGGGIGLRPGFLAQLERELARKGASSVPVRASVLAERAGAVGAANAAAAAFTAAAASLETAPDSTTEIGSSTPQPRTVSTPTADRL